MDKDAKGKRGDVSLHEVRFPGESAAYRKARDDLLRAEMALRGQIEAVAAQRRALPMGAAVAEDYVFEEGAPGLDDSAAVRSVRLSELFESGKPSLIAYSFMYGPEAKNACPMCTSMLDSLNGSALHVAERANLVVIAKSPIQRVRTFHFYNTELLFAPHEAEQDPRHVDLIWPLWNVFDLIPEGRSADWYPKLHSAGRSAPGSP
ncbi:MAG: DUF899 family protein [Burkholderiaceae bacterium]